LISFSGRNTSLEEKADAITVEIACFYSQLIVMSEFSLQFHCLEQLIIIKVLSPNGKRSQTK
jgi:hypothetical protein